MHMNLYYIYLRSYSGFLCVEYIYSWSSADGNTLSLSVDILTLWHQIQWQTVNNNGTIL